jgi:hypothetical protein
MYRHIHTQTQINFIVLVKVRKKPASSNHDDDDGKYLYRRENLCKCQNLALKHDDDEKRGHK